MSNAVAKFEAPRLPYHPAMEERFGVDAAGWKALTEAVWPTAKTPDSVALALSYCKARNLDPFKKPVHIVPVWSTALGRMTEGVWPGISELRTTAMRTSQYAGCDKTTFGPMIEHKFANGMTLLIPEWAQKTVYRFVKGVRVAFEGPEVYWLETYATQKRDSDVPNAMWTKRPRGQLDKCAEAAALRGAFPEEIGDEMTAEEMAGKVVGFVDDAAPVRPQTRRLHAGFDDPNEEPPKTAQEASPPADEPESPPEDAEPAQDADFEPVPPADAEILDEPGEFDDPDDFPGDRKAPAEDAWDHISWIAGTKDQAATFKDKKSIRIWWNVIADGEEYTRLAAISQGLADRLRQDVIDYAETLK